MEPLWQDVRFGLRSLRKTPGTTVLVLVVLALGIGANTAIFSVANTLLLRPLPVADPQRLISLGRTTPDTQTTAFSYPDLLDLREGVALLDGLAGFAPITVSMGADGDAEMVNGEIVTDDYFELLGVRPLFGRTLSAAEDGGPGSAVVILGHALWRRRFGADPSVLGRQVSINGVMVAIVGIAPEAFTGVRRERPSQMWVPMGLQASLRPPSPALRRRLGGGDLLSQRRVNWVDLVGRLAPGVGRGEAATALNAVVRRLALEYPDVYRDTTVAVLSLGEDPVITERVMSPLRVLLAVVGLVLLLACANVSGLQLSRAVGRRREIALRMALGSGRVRVVRQLLVENLLLAIAGAAGGVALAGAGLPWIATRVPLTRGIVPALDARVLVFTLAVGVAAGLLAGLVPAGVASRVDIGRVLKDEHAPAGGSRRRATLRSSLVAAQLAISLVLLIGAALFVRTLEHARTTDPGFSISGLLNLSVDPGVLRYDETAGQLLYAGILERLRALPGVTAASADRIVPLSGSARIVGVTVGDAGSASGEEPRGVFSNTVATGYFATLGIPMVRGRDFEAGDRDGAVPVAIVNQTAAALLWPGADPVGRRVTTAAGVTLEVVGVARDSRYVNVREESLPVIYVPLAQNYESSLTFHLRTAGSPGALLAAARAAIGEVDPALPVTDVRTMADAAGAALGQERMLAIGLGLFAGLALVIAGAGLFGVTAHAVGQRTREIGVRVALGATRRQVLGLVMGQCLRVVAIGAGVGLLTALAFGRLVAGLLFGLAPGDPASLATALVVLSVAALVAAWLPARRAIRVDPVAALRAE